MAKILDTGEHLLQYAHHWNGVYDREKSLLTLTPKLTPSVVSRGNEYYDEQIAEIQNGIIVPRKDSQFQPLPLDKYENQSGALNAEIPSHQGSDKLIFRGINYEGMKSFLIDGEMVAGPKVQSFFGDKFRLYFGLTPSVAAWYAARGQGRYEMATFAHPSYLVAIKSTGVEEDDLKDGIINRPVKLDEVVKIYEIRPFKMVTGHIPLQVNESYMELPHPITQFDHAPTGEFAYRELTLQETEDYFNIHQ